MTDSQEVLLVLIVIYLLECVGCLCRESIGFRWYRCGCGTWLLPSRLFGTPEVGLARKPFTSFGTFVVSTPLPISISPSGLFSYLPDAACRDHRREQEQRLVTWEAIESVAHFEKTIHINGRLFARAGSEPAAMRTVELIERVWNRPAGERERLIESAFADALDMTQIEQRLTQFRERTGTLRWLCLLQFFLLFVAGPLSIWWYGWRLCWLGLFLGIVCINCAIAFLFLRAHRKMITPSLAVKPWTGLATILLNPMAAIRAGDYLSREILSGFHPVAIASVVCSKESFEALARFTICDLTHPMLPVCPCPEPDAQAVEAWCRQQRLDALSTFLRRTGLDPVHALLPTSIFESSVRSFCPRCHQGYELLDGVCSSCGGMRLRPLEVT